MGFALELCSGSGLHVLPKVSTCSNKRHCFPCTFTLLVYGQGLIPAGWLPAAIYYHLRRTYMFRQIFFPWFLYNIKQYLFFKCNAYIILTFLVNY